MDFLGSEISEILGFSTEEVKNVHSFNVLVLNVINESITPASLL